MMSDDMAQQVERRACTRAATTLFQHAEAGYMRYILMAPMMRRRFSYSSHDIAPASFECMTPTRP